MRELIKQFRFSKKEQEELDLSVHLFGKRCGVSLTFDPSGDHDIDFSLKLPLLASVYGGIRHPLARLATDFITEALPTDMGMRFSACTFDLSVFDTALWWKFGVDPMGWTTTRSKWRDGSWHPLGHNCQQTCEIVAEAVILAFPMPEDVYFGKMTIERVTYGWDKLPRVFDKMLYRADVVMLEDEQIPHPGKGENSWDCGEDALFSSSFPLPHNEFDPQAMVNYAVGEVITKQCQLRDRRGGKDWMPELSKDERKKRRLAALEERRLNPLPEPMCAVATNGKVQA